MKIFARLLALFLILPIVELALLVQLAQVIDFWPTIGLIIVTGFLGSYFAKREGLAVWRTFNARLNEGGLPGKEVVDGIIILCAGALLISPGVITDLLGIIGLFPPTRSLIRRYVMKRVERSMRERTLHMGFSTFRADAYGDRSSPDGGAYEWTGTPRDLPGYAAGKRPGDEAGT